MDCMAAAAAMAGLKYASEGVTRQWDGETAELWLVLQVPSELAGGVSARTFSGWGVPGKRSVPWLWPAPEPMRGQGLANLHWKPVQAV